MTRAPFITTLSLVIASLVLLSSLHAAQVLGAAAIPDGAKKVAHDTDPAKLVGELHHHSDKTGSQLIKDAGDHQYYVDSRSLRLRVTKKDSLRDRLAARWHRAWQELSLLHKA